MNSEPQPVARIVPPGAGAAWISQGLVWMRAQAGRLFLMVVLLQFIMGLTQVPLVGLFLMIAVPALSAGLLQAFSLVSEGARPPVLILFQPLVSGARASRLLVLGILMFVVGVLIVAMLLPPTEALMDPELLSRIEQGDIEALSAVDRESLSSMVVAFLIGIAISGTLSYMTIPLIWFHDCKLVTALFQGLRAMFMNWKPFLVLGLGMVALLIPLTLVAALLFALAQGAGAFSVLVMALVMILILAFQLLIFGTQFCAFRDIFGLESKSLEPPAPDDSQLLA